MIYFDWDNAAGGNLFYFNYIETFLNFWYTFNQVENS
jgi:hypothetical protein